MRDTVVEVAVAVEVHLDLAGFLRCPVHEAGQFRFCACRFFLASKRGFPLTLHDISHLRAHIAVTAYVSGIEEAKGSDRLDAFIRLRGGEGVTAASADAESADTFGIDTEILLDVVDGSQDVTDPVGRFVGAARLSTALSLITGIEGNGNESRLGEFLGIKTGNLVFASTIGMCHHDSGILPGRVIVSRRINAGPTAFAYFRKIRQYVGKSLTSHYNEKRSHHTGYAPRYRRWRGGAAPGSHPLPGGFLRDWL